MEKEIHITFMRHGRSRAEDEEVHEGRYDSPLTDIGRAQAQIRAQEFLTEKAP
jgi:2,3-bisphosphoglycerate-dependent phosphoglycerate mutase